jgi:hypothetical protein
MSLPVILCVVVPLFLVITLWWAYLDREDD